MIPVMFVRMLYAMDSQIPVSVPPASLGKTANVVSKTNFKRQMSVDLESIIYLLICNQKLINCVMSF